jgi:tetratricopeptide (TPR) repeat protein
MSHLAAQLGNPREIAQLARAAQEGSRGRVTPRALAMFHAAEARGHAVLGDAVSAEAARGRALDAMEAAGAATEAGDDPVWISHFDEAYLADELAHCHRDLGQAEQAERYARQSLDGHPASRARRRAIGQVLLATAQLQRRELEQACATALGAAELLGSLRSNRGTEYLDDFRHRLEPYRAEAPVRAFAERLAAA